MACCHAMKLAMFLPLPFISIEYVCFITIEAVSTRLTDLKYAMLPTYIVAKINTNNQRSHFTGAILTLTTRLISDLWKVFSIPAKKQL